MATEVQQKATTGDPEYARNAVNTTNVSWYCENIEPHLQPEMRKLLKNYSGLKEEELMPHIYEMRTKFWKVRAYPCIGNGLYLIPLVQHFPWYQDMLQKLQSDPSATLLDVGTFIGHDMRAMVADGAPPKQLRALDIVNFWDLGFEMFRDKGRFPVEWIEGDLFDEDLAKEEPSRQGIATNAPKAGEPVKTIKELAHSVEIVYVSSVLHAYTWDRQKAASKNLIKLTRGPGSIITGYNVGAPKHRDFDSNKGFTSESKPFLHDPQTYKAQWKELEKETDTEWEMDIRLCPWEKLGANREMLLPYLGPDLEMIQFCFTRKR